MELAKNVHLLTSTKGSYCYVVLGSEPVLIDTCRPGHADGIIAELGTLGLKPTDLAHILLTHHDIDHIGNAAALKRASGAKLWAPKIDLPYILNQKPRPGLKRLVAAISKPEQPAVDATYAPGQRIAAIETIPTPGHTPGHVSFLFGDALFSGDLVMSVGGKLRAMPGLITWDRKELQRSLNHVKNFAFDWVCTAHGEPVRRGNLWDALVERT